MDGESGSYDGTWNASLVFSRLGGSNAQLFEPGFWQGLEEMSWFLWSCGEKQWRRAVVDGGRNVS